MPLSQRISSQSLQPQPGPIRPRLPLLLLLLLLAPLAHAGVIRGTVKDQTGATVKGASIVLKNGASYVGTTVSASDGSFNFVTGQSGRFQLIITAASFRQLEPTSFYAGRNDSVEKILVMEPQYVHESIVVTATGTPVAQQQTSEATSVLTNLDLSRRDDIVDSLRIQPGVSVTQLGQRGAQTSLFIRGGDSNAGKILSDGVSITEIGGLYDFGNLSTTGIDSAELYRGPNSSLYGADAASGVLNLRTPRGFSSSPQLTFHGDIGNFFTSRQELELAGSRNKLDYYAGYAWLQTSNALPMDQYHNGSSTANVGYQPTASIQLRGTARYAVSAVGVPNAWNFYRIADDRKQSDQNLYIGAAIDWQIIPDLHMQARYGAARKREQSQQWYPAGLCVPVNTCDTPDSSGTYGNYYGEDVTFRGANGAQTAGQAILNYSAGNFSVYPNKLDLTTNRDELNYQADWHLTPHFTALAGFRFENQRGTEVEPAYALNQAVERNNYDYLAEVHGDFKTRFFYTLGGSLQRYSIIGTQTSPRAGISYYLFRPRPGKFNGTRISGNFADAVREPTLADQTGSLYSFLSANGGQSTIQQLHIPQLAAPTARTWEGSIEQGLISDRLIAHLNVFHNQFGRQIESVGVSLIPQLLPNLTALQQQQLQAFLNNNNAFSLDVNSQAYRALGVETTLESGIGRSFFLKGGYTYLDSVVQRSFSSDNAALLGGYEPTYGGIPVGIYSPLKGARPFRRPPHTGFLSASYAGQRWTALSTIAFSSRSDDSTFLGYSDLQQGNSLLLPNRNLDYGFAKIDLGASYQAFTRIGIYGQAENLLSNQHIAPIGYPSLPMNFRAGVRIQVGKRGQ